VRNAAVTALVETKPADAARVWKGHPDSELGVAMIAIAAAARSGRPVDNTVFGQVADAALKAPLAAEPYLVRGVQAQVEGDAKLARRAFEAAQRRDPRSLPARYFLADHYLRTGDLRRGLLEFAALARLTPNGATSVSPYVASYARDRRNWPQLRAMLRSDPDLAESTLEALARDGANDTAILALADPPHRTSKSGWLPVLLASLVSQREYARARAIWVDVAGVRTRSGQLLFDADFKNADAPPPFNWTLTSSTVGLAERQTGGRLHVIFYGQEDGVLASQLLVLPPGRYALGMHVSGGERMSSLRWALTCADAQAPFASRPLDAFAKGSLTFEVPQGCGAQRLDLVGSSSDIAQQVDATVWGVSLARVVSGA
jgi:hypothetical protein